MSLKATLGRTAHVKSLVDSYFRSQIGTTPPSLKHAYVFLSIKLIEFLVSYSGWTSTEVNAQFVYFCQIGRINWLEPDRATAERSRCNYSMRTHKINENTYSRKTHWASRWSIIVSGWAFSQFTLNIEGKWPNWKLQCVQTAKYEVVYSSISIEYSMLQWHRSGMHGHIHTHTQNVEHVWRWASPRKGGTNECTSYVYNCTLEYAIGNHAYEYIHMAIAIAKILLTWLE